MNNKQKIIYYYFIILPIIDVITSLIARFANINISLGMVIKALTMIFTVLYILFFSKSTYRKPSVYYIIALGLYGLIYFLTKSELFNIHSIAYEINYAFHYMYFPLMILGVFNIFEDFKISKEIIYKVLFINCIMYTLLLLVPFFTHTSFNSYNWNNVKGKNGWFYSANETGAISMLLLSSMLYLLDNKKKYKVLFAIPLLLSIALIGTKVSFLGMILITALVAIVFIMKTKKERFKLPIALIAILIVICQFSPTLSNLKGQMELIEEDDDVVERQYKYEKIEDIIKNKKVAKIVKLSLNGRESFFLKNYSVYEESRPVDKLFGISWSTRESIRYDVIKKLIEIDYLDIIIHYGIIGFIIYFMPLIYLFIRMIKKKSKKAPEFWLYLTVFLLELFISSFAGHVLSAPAVSIYLVLVMYIIKLNSVNQEKV